MSEVEIERRVNVLFEKTKDYDDRFMSVKIWLMHLGQNLNGSYFSKDVVEAAIPSLANTPILGYIVDNNGEEDFSEHKMILTKNAKGKYILRYIGRAYGLIPETNNAQFEMRVCEDGIEREFLTVEGLMWNKWDIPEEIMLRDLVKNQSMEIDEDYDGYFDKNDKLFHFTRIKFFGSCILGDDVRPAMVSSDIEINYSMKNLEWQKEIQENMELFKTLYSTKDKDGEKMKDKLLEILAIYSLTEELALEKGINLSEYETEEAFVNFEAVVQEAIKEVQVEPNIDPVVVFSLTSDQISQELRKELSKITKNDGYGYVYQNLWLVDYIPDTTIAIVYDCDTNSLLGYSYKINNENVSIDFDSVKEYKMQYVPKAGTDENSTEFSLIPKDFSDLKLGQEVTKAKEEAITEISEKFSTMEAQMKDIEAEVVELRQFKSAKDSEDKEAKLSELFSQFSQQLTEEELAQAKTDFSSMEIADIEKELFAIVGKKSTKFSNKTPKSTMRISVFPEDDNKAPGYAYILEKGNKFSQQ